jgi:hypothetical protein
MSDKFVKPGAKLEALFRDLREARVRALERRYLEPMDCLSFTRLMRITQGDVKATEKEAKHLAGCRRCKRFMELAKPNLPVMPPLKQASATVEISSGKLSEMSILVERISEAGELMPSRLPPEEELKAHESGAELAERMLRRQSSHSLNQVLAQAIECVSVELQKPIQVVESICLGWSDPFAVAAEAATGSIELNAKLSRGVGGKVHLEINPFRAVVLRSEFDYPSAVTVLLVDLQASKPVAFTFGDRLSSSVTLASQTTIKGFVTLPESANAKDLELVVLAIGEQG